MAQEPRRNPSALGGAAGALAQTGDNGKPKRKQSRPQGPRSLWIVLNEGQDPNTVRAAINMITFNGRVVLQNMEEGSPRPMLKFTLAQGPKRGRGGDDEGEQFVAEGTPGAEPTA